MMTQFVTRMEKLVKFIQTEKVMAFFNVVIETK